MLEDLRGYVVFSHVVEAQSFSKAAQRLGITKSAVSKHIQQLESRLGVQLLVRTTRKLSTTDVGERVYAASLSLREGADAAQEAALTHTGVISGTLRLTASSVFGRKHVVPVVTAFMERHPELNVELVLTDTFLDLVEARIDVAIRVGRIVDPSLVVRKLVRVPFAMCASPRYLARHGVPKTPRDLEKLEWIRHMPRQQPGVLALHKGGRTVTIELRGRLSCNDGAAGVQAAVDGFGLVVAPAFELREEVEAGKLVPLLTSWRAEDLPVHAVFPPRRHVSAKVRAFTDFLAARFREAPWDLP